MRSLFATIFGGLWDALMSRLFGSKKDPEVEEARHEATIAQKQAAIVADHDHIDALDSLRRDEF